MAKKITAYIRLQIKAQEANPSPPVGPALGQHGVNIMDFCKAFNAKTQDLGLEKGLITPVVITVYSDRSYTFIIKTPPASVLLKKTLAIKKGSATAPKDIVGTATRDQLLEIAKIKQPDLTAKDEAGALRTIAGTARSMGIKVKGLDKETGGAAT